MTVGVADGGLKEVVRGRISAREEQRVSDAGGSASKDVASVGSDCCKMYYP